MNIGPEPVPAGSAREALAAVALGVALTLLAFYPGLMSIDSALQFAQARGLLPLDDIHPPLMTLLWRASDRLVAGPGLLFAGFVLAWWTGLVALFWQAGLDRPRRWWALGLVGLWPATFLMLGHVWKDVAMAAALLAAAAAILAWQRGGRRAWAVAALALLLAACALRHNAIAAALPLLGWLAWPRAPARWSPGRGGLVALGLALLLLGPWLLERATRASRVQPWSVVAQWDLAALSLAAGEVLLPASQRGAGLQLADLQAGYVPWANPPLFEHARLRLSFYQPLSAAEQHELLDAWFDAVRREPWAYLRHRARLARYLLFGFPAALPRELVYVPRREVLPGVDYAPPAVDEQAWLWRAAAALRPTPLFAGALYLALALAAVLWARRRLPVPQRGAVFALGLSSYCNALPLFFISGSAEFRYLTWTALAALAAFALALLGARPHFR